MVLLLLVALLAPEARPAWAVTIVPIKFLFNITADFNEPSDVAVSKAGRIYVVDGVNDKIKIFRSDGSAVSSFGEPGNSAGQFNSPLGIDVDGAGNIYIADTGNSRIQVFTPEGDFIQAINLPPKNGHRSDPTDVAADGTRNRLYVVDNDNHRYLVYDLMSRNLITVAGRPGEGELMFRYPFFAALNQEGFLHIVDVINTRVQVINPHGQFVRYIGGWGVEKGHFFRPKGVAVDNRSRVYVSDSYMGVVQVFESSGRFVGVLGDAKQRAIIRFKTPTGMFIDEHNRLFVVEMLAQQIGVYRIDTGDR